MKENVINNAPREIAPAVENNAPRVASEKENVVINFASDESREAEARALKTREAEASDATKRRENAVSLLKSARENLKALRESEATANYNAARSRFAAGKATAADRVLLKNYAAASFARSILEAAAASRAAIEATDAAKKATKAIRDKERETSLSRALRDLIDILPLYNAKFSLFGFTLEAADVAPYLFKIDNLTPFLFAPTADGARVANLRRGKLTPVTNWTAARAADILIDNAVISAAVEAAPRAAILEALNARDNAAALKAEAAAIAEIISDRKKRADGLQRTIKNPRSRAETKARAAADLEALNAEISQYNAKFQKATEAASEAAKKAAALRAVALEAAEIAPADLQRVEALRDTLNNAKAEAAAALNAAISAKNIAASIAASEARKQKKSVNADLLKKADPAALLATEAPADVAKEIAAARAFAPADLEKAIAAARVADNAAAALREASEAEAAAIKESAKADPAARYRVLLEIASDAMKAAREAKAKKAKAADVKETPEISDRDFIKIAEESEAADATAAAALEALNAESPAADQIRAAAEALRQQREATPEAEASDPAAAVA